MNFYLYKGAWLYDAQPRNLRERERALGAPLKYARARKFNKAPITRNAHFASYVPLPASSLIIFPFKVAECSFSLPSFFLTRSDLFFNLKAAGRPAAEFLSKLQGRVGLAVVLRAGSFGGFLWPKSEIIIAMRVDSANAISWERRYRWWDFAYIERSLTTRHNFAESIKTGRKLWDNGYRQIRLIYKLATLIDGAEKVYNFISEVWKLPFVKEG